MTERGPQEAVHATEHAHRDAWPHRISADVRGTPALAAHGTAHLPTLQLDLDLDARAGEILGFVGPNGAGKSATIAVLLGLLPLSRGTIAAGGRIVDDGVRRTPPERRGLGWCPQVPALLPRRRPIDQVTLFADPTSPAMREGGASQLLARLGLDPGDRRPPHRLSVGQAQRVALARALVASAIVLLDEPTSAQDPEGARATREAIRAHADAGGTAVLVAHRPEDAYAIADRLVVLDAGRVVQSGPPRELALRPANGYVAHVVGAVVVEGDVDRGHLRGPWGELTVPDDTPDGPASAVVRPAAVTLHRERPAGSPRNVISATVASLGRTPDGIRVGLAGDLPLVAALTAAAAEELGLRVGDRVWAAVKANEVSVTPRSHGGGSGGSAVPPGLSQ